jgi:hypothetical protein
VCLAFANERDLTDGRPEQWARDTLLPGKPNLHAVRELFEIRNLS